MGVVMKLARIFQVSCGLFVAVIGGIVIYGFSTDDYSGKPSRETLRTELSGLQSQMGFSQRVSSYFDKGVLKGLSVTSPLPSKFGAFASSFDKSAKDNGWIPAPSKVSDENFHRKYCKGRMTLMLDSVKGVPPYIEYGVYWAANESSNAYCSSKVKS